MKARTAIKLYAVKRRLSHHLRWVTWSLSSLGLIAKFQWQTLCQQACKTLLWAFKLIRATGDVAFELELPQTSKIYLVFHVSQLKPCHGFNHPSLDLAQAQLTTNQFSGEPGT